MVTEIAPVRTPEQAPMEPVPSAVFIGGATSTYKGLGGIDSVLKKRFGEKNASVYNSLLSPELSAPDRFIRMGEDLKAKMQQGPVTVIAHSFVAELYAAMQTDPEFFQKQDNLKNLRLILISPALPENAREGVAMVGRYGRIALQEGNGLGGRTLPGKTRNLRGIVSTGVLPVAEADFADVKEHARQAAGEISHVTRSTTGTVVDFTTQRDYTPVLTEKEIETMSHADADYRDAITVGGRRKARALRRRGFAANKTLFRVNKTDFTKLGETEMEGTHNRPSWGTAKLTGKLLKDTFVNGNVYNFIKALAGNGVKTTIVIPEFDTLMTPRKAQDLGNVDNIDVVIGAHATHGFPWADQPEWLLNLLDYQQQKLLLNP